MPPPSANSLILVTGGNGFIGAWVIRTLLDRGYAVRAALRSLDRASSLEEVFGSHVAQGRLEFVVVEDLTKEGAYDAALSGVTGVLHLASPVGARNAASPEDVIGPARKGTLEILNGALRVSKQQGGLLKRVVITSSVAAVLTPRPADASGGVRTFTEEDWNDQSVKDVEERGKDASGVLIYVASKALAERAAWEFYDRHKAAISWDMVVINPPYIFGPPVQNIRSFDALGPTMKMWYGFAIAPGPKPRELLASSENWADVRDVAEAHVRALESNAAGGERILISNGSYITQEWLDLVNRLKVLPENRNLPVGLPDITKDTIEYTVVYNTAKAGKLLGMQYRSKEETTKDILEWLLKAGL